MPNLRIENFSCLDQADLKVGRMTVLIGPQATGKSVISKLLYFFAEVFSEIFTNAEETNTYRLFERSLAKRFGEMFPSSAWGDKPFSIRYEAGPAVFSVERKASGRRAVDEVSFSTSPYVKSIYDEVLQAYRRASKKRISDEEGLISRRYERFWPIIRDTTRRLESDLGIEYPASQMFVPAGRSFYTNLGKAVVILEHGSQLDEITKDFGRVFTSLLDGRSFAYMGDKPSTRFRDFVKHQKTITDEIFGGEVKLSKNDMHVATKDGRKVPLATLSSGQQELLPLILFLKYYTNGIGRRRDTNSADYLFVEEPEAHLFPASQGMLTQHLVETANFGRGSGRLFITTHSPYVLAKMNNLIQADLTASLSEEHALRVASVIPKAAWLSHKELSAYAIEGRVVKSIKDESGLIDASYLDNISNEINEDFMSLLDIENDL